MNKKTILSWIFIAILIAVFAYYYLDHMTPPTTANSLSEVRESIYTIRPNGLYRPGGYGTGVLIDNETLVTAWHVLRSTYAEIPKDRWHTYNVTIQKSSIHSEPFEAQLLAYDAKRDVAILHVPDLMCPCTPIKDQWVFHEDEVIVAYRLNSINGVIINEGHLINKTTNDIHSNNNIYFGASGGAVIIKSGNQYVLVGIIRAIPQAANGYPLNYITISTPSSHAIKLLDKIQKDSID